MCGARARAREIDHSPGNGIGDRRGELDLAAVEVIRPEETRLILPTDMDPIWPAMSASLGAYLWESLRIGTGLAPEIIDLTEQLTVAVGGISCGASVTMTTAGATLVLHFGGIQPGDARIALIETPINAVRALAADARALSVPSIPGSLAEQVQHRARCAAFGIRRGIDHTLQPSVERRARAHGAWLQRDMQFTAIQTVIAQREGGFADRLHFGMRARVLPGDGGVAAASDDLAVLDDHRADGYFALGLCKAGLLQRGAHPNGVKRVVGHVRSVARVRQLTLPSRPGSQALPLSPSRSIQSAKACSCALPLA